MYHGHSYNKIKTLIEDYHNDLTIWSKANFQGIVTFDMIDWIIPFEPFNVYTGSDELHLSITGNNMFSNYMMNVMKGGKPNCNVSYNLSSVSGVSSINNTYMKAKLVISDNMQVYQFFVITLLTSVNNNAEIFVAEMPFGSDKRPYYWESMSPINSVAFIGDTPAGIIFVDYGTGKLKFKNTSGSTINANVELKCGGLVGNIY